MKPHIVYLHPHFTLAGGAGTYVLETGVILAKRGYRVTVVCIRAEKKLVQQCQDVIQFIEIGGALSSSLFHWLLLPFFFIRLVLTVRKLEPCVLFPQVFPANWWGFLYKLFNRKTALIWMCQEPSAFIHSKAWIKALPESSIKVCVKVFNPVLRHIDIWLSRYANTVLANSEYTKRYAQEIYPFVSNRISVTKLGVNHERFKPPMNSHTRKRQIITIGRLTGFKNIDTIIDALAKLDREEEQEVELVIVGKGEDEARLKSYVLDHKLEARVRFVGHVSDSELVKLLQESRACVLASVDEPFGLVVVEAMACGTPAIVVDQGGPAETVVDGKSGFYFPAFNSTVLSEKIRSLMSDELFEQLSLGAVDRAREYHWEHSTDDIEQQICELPKIRSQQWESMQSI